VTVRALSNTGDMTFGNSAGNFYSNVPAAVGQIVQTSLLLWIGEWNYDTSQGMTWLQGVLGKHNQATADLTIQDFVLNITGVVNIANFQSVDTQSDRNYLATFLLNTVYGPTPVQIANYPIY
jgi:hypothetical protein